MVNGLVKVGSGGERDGFVLRFVPGVGLAWVSQAQSVEMTRRALAQPSYSSRQRVGQRLASPKDRNSAPRWRF